MVSDSGCLKYYFGKDSEEGLGLIKINIVNTNDISHRDQHGNTSSHATHSQ